MYDAIGLPVSWAFETDCAYGDFIGSRIAAVDGAAQTPDIGQRACVGRTGWLEQDRTLGWPAIGSGSADRPTARQAGDVGYEQGVDALALEPGMSLTGLRDVVLRDYMS